MIQRQRWIYGIILTAAITLILNNAEAGYRSEVSKWTKGGRAFSTETFDAKLIWKATLLSDDLLNAQSNLLIEKKISKTYPATDDKRVKFFISLYTQKELKDFSLDRNSTWRVFLVGSDGIETEPAVIQHITITPTEKFFYPYLNRWSKAYMVEFPSVDLGSNPKLILRSITAESILKWKMKGN